MKERIDLVQGWLRKAASNFTAMEAARQAQVYDAACFHAQQAVEIYLKAYLIFVEQAKTAVMEVKVFIRNRLPVKIWVE